MSLESPLKLPADAGEVGGGYFMRIKRREELKLDIPFGFYAILFKSC